MEIKDLQARMGNVDVVVTVVEKGDVRTFEKFGKSGRVSNAVVEDGTGRVKLTLWNDDVDKVQLGDKVHIKNGWVGEYQGELQLSTGKFGSLEVVGKSEQGTAPQNTPEPAPVSPEAPESKEELSEEPITEEEVVE